MMAVETGELDGQRDQSERTTNRAGGGRGCGMPPV